jgi:hypothetical protein
MGHETVIKLFTNPLPTQHQNPNQGTTKLTSARINQISTLTTTCGNSTFSPRKYLLMK